MAATFVKSIASGGSAAGGSSLVITASATSAAGNMLVARVTTSGGTLPTIIDSQGNTWSTATRIANVTTLTVGLFYLFNAPSAVSGTTTFTAQAAGTNTIAFSVDEYSGTTLTDPLDKAVSAVGSSTTPSSGPTPTTTQANEMLVGAFSQGSNKAFTQGTGFNKRTSIAGNQAGAVIRQSDGEDEYVTATGAYSATGTYATSAQTYAAAIATFLEASPPVAPLQYVYVPRYQN